MKNFFTVAHCLLTAYALEYCWRKFTRIQGHLTRKPSQKLKQQSALCKAFIDCPTLRYEILTKDAAFPEKLAI